jgi:hypothetical protein
MTRTRVRIRYRKQDDLRWLGHHDLVRAWDRLLRRADARPAMSEGFHKRPRMNFPSALAVGIGSLDEVLELELEDDCDLDELQSRFNAHAPPGLSIVSIERMAPPARFSQPAAAVYEIRVPADRCESVRAHLARLQRAPSGPHTADAALSPDAPLDSASSASTATAGAVVETATAAPATLAPVEPASLPAAVRNVTLDDDVLRMDLRLGEAGAVRPRELLAIFGLEDLEATGAQLVRTRVEVKS